MNFAAKIAELTQQLADKDLAHATLQTSHKGLAEANQQLTADLGKANTDLATANATIADLKVKAEKTSEQIAAAVVQTVAAAGVEPVARVEASDKIDGQPDKQLTGMSKATAYFASRQKPAA